MRTEELSALISRQPRAALAHLPTPLEPFRDLLVKRDDQTGLAFGGSKLRMLEFFLGDALRRGAQILVTAGPPQSNHCRLTAAASARHGLQCRLLLISDDEDGGDLCGNRALSHLFGAESVRVHRASAPQEIADFLARLQREGTPFYFIEGGGHVPMALWGYLQASVELMTQFDVAGIKPDRLFLACGRGTTQAGLLLGLRLLGCPIPVIGASVARDRDRCRGEIREVIERFCRLYGLENPVTEHDIEVDDRWIGSGYGEVPPERWRIVAEQARDRGLLLDPLYTSRAMLALLEHVRRREHETVLLMHTGGLPTLFEASLSDGLARA